TYRECLRDVFDVPALQELLRGRHTRELPLVGAEPSRPSPFASPLLFDSVATSLPYVDSPLVPRRPAALARDRDLLAGPLRRPAGHLPRACRGAAAAARAPLRTHAWPVYHG